MKPVAALRVRRRSDVETSAQTFGSRRVWSLKDPLSHRFYHLVDEEFWILEQFDGTRTVDEVLAAFQRQFAPRRLSMAVLRGFIDDLHREGLLIADTPGQGRVLLRRRGEIRRRRRLYWWTRLFSIRFRGWDPDRFLNRVSAEVRPLLSPMALGFWTVLIVTALTTTASHAAQVRFELGRLSELLGPQNWLGLAALFGLTRLVHELGHALVCKHLGGECHEIGVMLFLFTPTAYCDVSDAWMMPSKWARMAVSAAGIGVELVLASLAALTWQHTYPGALHDACFLVMLFCSVNTLILNGNPLMRYDGYHVLADFVEIPHLMQRADDVWRRWATRLWFGRGAVGPAVDLLGRPTSTRATLALAAYAVAAKIYRLLVLIGGLILLNAWTQAHELWIVGLVVSAALVAAVVVVPAVRVGRRLIDPRVDRERHRLRFWLVTLGVAAAIAGLALAPLPRSIEAVARLRPARSEGVYVTQPGFLQNLTTSRKVVRGDVLATLEDDDLRRDVRKLETELSRLRTVLESMQRRQVAAGGAFDLPTARQALSDVEQRLAQRREDERRLTLRAPRDGDVLPPADRRPDASDGRRLSDWSGSPWDAANRGAYLETGTLLCDVAERGAMEAVAEIDERDVQAIHPGAEAKLLIDEARNDVRRGRVVDVGKAPPAGDSASTSGESRRSTRDRNASTLTAPFQVRIALDEPVDEWLIDQPVRLKITVAAESIGAKLRRLAAQTFRLD